MLWFGKKRRLPSDDRWEVPSSDIQRHGVTNFVGPLGHGLDRQVLPSMFVCGGGDGRHARPLSSLHLFLPPCPAGAQVLNSAEVLDLGGIWQGLQPMASPRVLQSAERFDPASGSWEEKFEDFFDMDQKLPASGELPAMSCARWDATAVVADCLYVLGGTDESEALNSAERFNHQSGEAQAELELKDAELKACGGPENCDNPGWLREEYQALQSQLSQLQEQAKRSGQESASFRMSRSAILEDELRQKSEVVRQLRQRELWFELQLQRQQEAHGEALDSLRDEVFALRKQALMRRLPSASKAASITTAPSQTIPAYSGQMCPQTQPQSWKKATWL
ncbi:unnamed protein product [Cladocopium goreaui]|uniref:Uncharacterized protein n=1 Tax=Cladocopium goreaui TaxID=2562237 RepID=A0A9P1CVB4_9DINO|nr:unnamed protein product [Cladocopium goreaui]